MRTVVRHAQRERSLSPLRRTSPATQYASSGRQAQTIAGPWLNRSSGQDSRRIDFLRPACSIHSGQPAYATELGSVSPKSDSRLRTLASPSPCPPKHKHTYRSADNHRGHEDEILVQSKVSLAPPCVENLPHMPGRGVWGHWRAGFYHEPIPNQRYRRRKEHCANKLSQNLLRHPGKLLGDLVSVKGRDRSPGRFW